MNSTTPPRHWRYLRDRDVQVAGVITVLVLLLSAGLVWLAYLLHVCRIAVRSPLVPSRRAVVLVFGRRLILGAPGPDYQQRLARALALVEHGHADHLLLLGGCSGAPPTEAAAGESWLREHGLRSDVRLDLEQDSVDSLENLRHARQLLRRDDASLPPVLLLTSRYHLARCRMLAARLGFEGLPVAAEAVLPLQPRYLGCLLVEASYLMWIDLGLRWATLTGNTRMTERIS